MEELHLVEKKEKIQFKTATMPMMWKISPYRQMLLEDLCLPSIRHEKHLSKRLTVDTGFSKGSEDYLRTRFIKLCSKEKPKVNS